MKIKILTSCAGSDFSFVAGENADIKNAIAKDLIRAGYAKEVKPDGKGDHSTGDGAGNPE